MKTGMLSPLFLMLWGCPNLWRWEGGAQKQGEEWCVLLGPWGCVGRAGPRGEMLCGLWMR